ncbi:ATP-binding response regulator [Ramlibacter sp. MAHUQ-53]|uniref:ATP-binding response regulator n=1 Tax=unclassified Ramlibacter TaxID=2617605 RepID=UPI00363B90C9
MPPPPPPDTGHEAQYIARETSSYLASAVRSTTVANFVAPLLTVPLFWDEADPVRFGLWLVYMIAAGIARYVLARQLETDPARIDDPVASMRTTTWCVGLIGVGWGLGWIILTPDLGMVNRLMYMYVTTGAMFSSMFGYGVHRPTFLAMCLPIFLPAIAAAFWPHNGFPWPFSVGVATLFISVLGISKRFARTYQDSLRQRLRNESLYQELVAERDASVSANVAKSRFIASASHDLRQPMHAVNFYLESLDLARLPEAARVVLGKIRSSVSNLNQMFESLLDVSKLDAFTFTAKDEPFRLRALAGALEQVGAPLADDQGIRFLVECPEAWAVGDEKLLRQLLLNLITNGIYYTAFGRVEVRFLSKDDRLVVEVQDTGCGISAEDQAHIFTEFYRVSGTRSRHDGLGLGLSIVKRLCDLLNARIELESRVGEGSLFRVITAMPVSVQRPELPPAAGEAAPGARVTLEGKTIAVIEDDANIAEAYRQTLSQRGARVLLLPEDPKRMQAALAEVDSIDFILSDFRLTDGTGEAAIQMLRENFNRDIPAIIVTADTSPAHIAHFRELHVPVLHKPISFQRVMDAIEQVLGAPPAR